MHQEAQKLTTTGKSRNSARVTRPSSRRGRNAGGQFSQRSHRTGSANAGAAGFFPRSIWVTNDAPLLVSTKSQTSSPSSATTSAARSEEHTSELQSQFHLVCRLLLEK